MDASGAGRCAWWGGGSGHAVPSAGKVGDRPGVGRTHSGFCRAPGHPARRLPRLHRLAFRRAWVWALAAYRRMTGDTACDGVLEATMRPEKIAAERALLRARPDFEMPYGRAWFLRLARENALHAGSKELQPMADEVLATMLAHYGAHKPDPRRGNYLSDSWA